MTTLIVPIYGYLHRKVKRVFNLEKIAKTRSLHFSDEDEVGTNIIALDVRKRKLFFLKKAPNIFSCLVVDLNTVVKCVIRKQYNSINAGDLNTKKLHHFLKSIFINLSFQNDTRTLSLSFYDAQKDKESDIEQLEEKAKKWQTTVSKLLSIQIKERA